MIEETIRHYLDQKGIRHTFVARGIGMNRKTFSAMMNGRRKATAEDMIRICRVLEKPLEFFAENPRQQENQP